MATRKSIRTERDRTLKILKRILQAILILIMLLCAFILICAFNPSLTEKLASKVQESQEESDVQEGEAQETDEALKTQEEAEESPLQQESEQGVEENLEAPVGQTNAGIYVAPAQEEVTSPESVKDRNGYEPVWEDGKQIEEEDAENIQKELETGEIGADLKFDPEFYPYYAMLDKDMKSLYRQIYANAKKLTTSFAPVVTVTAEQVKDVFEAVYNDHPELFWLETSYSCKYLKSGQCIEVTLKYYKIAEDLETAQKEFTAAAQQMISEANKLSNEAEKERYVHDALINTVDYHAGTSMSQSAYSALVEGRSVCAGYARAFQYVMMELGIPCYYCIGYSGEDHAWNIVKLGHEYYNVDVTWDDTKPSTYDYFNQTDADYAKTHMRTGLSVNLPACTGEEYHNNSVENTTQESEDGDMTEEDLLNAEAEDIINHNPQQPLEWEDYHTGTDEEEKTFEEELEEAGITEAEILDTLEEYYADCLKQMTKAGTGQQQFTNVIPQSLWSAMEQVYSDGTYEKGYVEEALKQMKMENFAIQLQTERLSEKYYRLYHNISTW